MLISRIPDVLDVCFDANETLLIEGEHGIGKSQVVESYSHENNIFHVTLFLSHQEVGDLIGMPRTIEKHGGSVHTWTKPIWLQRMEEAVLPDVVNFDDLVFNDREFQESVIKYLKDKNAEIS